MKVRGWDENRISWQAHRGGGGLERPDNTLVSLEFGWRLGGIPEVDIRLTADGVIVCQHDNDLARTTDAPPEIAHREIIELTFAEIRKYDAGARFAEVYRGAKVPALYEVFERMRNDPAKMIYVDLKNYDPALFPALKAEFSRLVGEYGVAGRIIVCSCDYELNCQMHHAVPGIHTMQWIGGSREAQIAVFEELASKRFACLDQIQLHLNDRADGEPDGWRYTLDAAFLKRALDCCTEAGISLEVFPWRAEPQEYFNLLNLGIRWYATDEPSKFCQAMNEWKKK